MIASERDTVRVRRKGSWRMLPLHEEGLSVGIARAMAVGTRVCMEYS